MTTLRHNRTAQLRSSENSGFCRAVDVGGCTGLARLVCLRTPPELGAFACNKEGRDTSLAGLLLFPGRGGQLAKGLALVILLGTSSCEVLTFAEAQRFFPRRVLQNEVYRDMSVCSAASKGSC